MITLSTEYVVLSIATKEAIWLSRLLQDLQASIKVPVVIMEDNQGTIALAKNTISLNRAKHIDIRYHHVREAVRDGHINLVYCPTSDLLTKALSRERFETLHLSMGLELI